ncbi:hypothetical protein [Comamonas guangdongensis]|uniref:Toxin CptA n=1 Tax=Comamonas guangdongensis TaxID=510515 RepID=A0ABV3ZNK3_9BURK
MSARYHAPAVAYAFERPGWAAGGLLLLWLALLSVMLLWCAQAWAGWAQAAAAVSASLAAAWLLWRQWRVWPQGRLLWDGGGWQVEAPLHMSATATSVHLRMGLDGGSWLWLQLLDVSAARPRTGRRRVLWIFVARNHSPAQWGDLRRAVYSSIVPLAEQG